MVLCTSVFAKSLKATGDLVVIATFLGVHKRTKADFLTQWLENRINYKTQV